MNDIVNTEPVTYSCREVKRAWWKKISIHKPGFDVITMSCFLMIVIHLLIYLSGGLLAHELVYNQLFGLKAESLFRGKIWQLVTYSFLHGNWFHLLANTAVIWLMGGRLLKILDQKKVALCLLLGSIVGGVVFVGFDSWSGQGALLVGSSGAVFALFILMAYLSPEAKMVPIPVRAKNMAIGVISASLILSLAHPGLNLPVFNLLTSWLKEAQMGSFFKVAHSCHLGGGIAGLWISRRVMGKMISLEDLQRSRID